MSYVDFYNQLVIDKSLEKELNFNPYYCEILSGLTDPLVIKGKEFINLAANNYLGLAADRRVKDAIIRTVEKYGASMCGSPVATGYVDIYCKVAEKLSHFVGLEATIIFPSGYQANTGLFPAIASKEDLIIADHYVHASLIQGIKSIGCKINPFLHNNINHLAKLLERASGYRRIFVVTESVFSAEGSIAPFDKIVDLCYQYNAISVIDDAHGIGVIGKSGRGILEEKNIKDFQGIYTASLGKALANTGGFISGKKELIEYLKYLCSGLVFSTAISPAVLGGVDKVLDIVEEEFHSRSEKIWQYKKVLTECLEECGFELDKSEAPIISLVGGGFESTIKLAKKLYDNGILSTPYIPPAVPPNGGRVRLVPCANLKESTIKKALEIFKKISKEKEH